MTNVDLPDREGGWCPECGQRLHGFDPTHGLRYWTCPGEHRPPVVHLGPENVTWSAALISAWITGGKEADGERYAFDAEAADPACFVDALCDRIETCRETARGRERERRAVASEQASATDDEQTGLGGWS